MVSSADWQERKRQFFRMSYTTLMLLPHGTMILARVYPQVRVHVDMTAFRRTCCVSCRADVRVPCSHECLYPLPRKGARGNSSDVSSMSLSTEGTWYLRGAYRLVFWANTRQVDGHVCVVFFQAVFLRTGFWSGVTARSCSTFRPRFFDKKSLAFGRPVHEISERF